MHNTRLIQFLKSLNSNEIRQFRDFVNSPAFNKNSNLSELFEILLRYYPKFKLKDLTEEKLFGILFGSEEFQYFKIKNLISDLFGLGKEFLAFNAFRNDNRAKEKYLLAELRVRNLDTAFQQAYKYAEKTFDKIRVKDENYYLHKMDLRNELMSYYVPKKPNVNFHFFQERLDLFVNYSVITLLKIYNIILHENYQNNFNFNMNMFDNVMEYLEKNKISDNPTLEVYYYILLLEKTKDEKYFYILMDLKNKYREELNVVDNYMLYLHLDGYCALAFNDLGRTDLLNVQFILAKEHPVSDMTEQGKILYPDFLNQVKKAIRVGEFEWAENFIEKYKNKLTDEVQRTLDFCYGFISYGKGDLDKAIEYFSKANFSSLIIKIQVKILLLQLNFEKGHNDQALLMVDAFKHYLSREKSLLGVITLSVSEFLKITMDLIKLKTEVSNKDWEYKFEKIKQDIDNMSNNRFGIKLWLLEQISKISK
ncbi:MAG: hypothetical protein IPM96_10180 [Ignavibacteria bacterium]|nr:hypothetical protein [Ignavibacteria bacterium]